MTRRPQRTMAGRALPAVTPSAKRLPVVRDGRIARARRLSPLTTPRLLGRRRGRRCRREVQGNRYARLQDVEHRAMRVNNLLQPCKIGVARAALQPHRSSHVLEARTHAILDGEEAAKIEIAFDLHRNRLERNTQRLGIGSVGDFLARGECAQNEFDRIRAGVGAAERFRLIDGQAELADFRLAPQPFDLTGIGRKGGDRVVGIGAQVSLHRHDSVFERHCGFSLMVQYLPPWTEILQSYIGKLTRITVYDRKSAKSKRVRTARGSTARSLSDARGLSALNSLICV